jgi:hypothetical protein
MKKNHDALGRVYKEDQGVSSSTVVPKNGASWAIPTILKLAE